MTTRLLLIAIILIIFFSGLSYFFYKQSQEYKTQAKENIALANTKAREAEVYKDKAGLLHSTNQVLTIEKGNLGKVLESEHLDHVRGVQGLKKNLKNLTETITADTKIDTTVKINETIHKILELKDSVWRSVHPWVIGTQTLEITMEQVLWDDEYNYVGIDSTGVNLVLKINVPIDGIVYWKRPHKFLFLHWGKKEYFSDFSTPNPLAKIPQNEVIQVRRK